MGGCKNGGKLEKRLRERVKVLLLAKSDCSYYYEFSMKNSEKVPNSYPYSNRPAKFEYCEKIHWTYNMETAKHLITIKHFHTNVMTHCFGDQVKYVQDISSLVD